MFELASFQYFVPLLGLCSLISTMMLKTCLYTCSSTFFPRYSGVWSESRTFTKHKLVSWQCSAGQRNQMCQTGRKNHSAPATAPSERVTYVPKIIAPTMPATRTLDTTGGSLIRFGKALKGNKTETYVEVAWLSWSVLLKLVMLTIWKQCLRNWDCLNKTTWLSKIIMYWSKAIQQIMHNPHNASSLPERCFKFLKDFPKRKLTKTKKNHENEPKSGKKVSAETFVECNVLLSAPISKSQSTLKVKCSTRKSIIHPFTSHFPASRQQPHQIWPKVRAFMFCLHKSSTCVKLLLHFPNKKMCLWFCQSRSRTPVPAQWTYSD